MVIKSFALNPFQENTYIVHNQDGECMIVDPGMYSASEQKLVVDYIEGHNLTPTLLVNTHCHIDHIFGNNFIHEKYGLPLMGHPLEVDLLNLGPQTAMMYGLNYDPSPAISVYLDEGQKIALGELSFEIIWTPGHSPGSICLLNTTHKTALVGDVLFDGSIGRTDLPGGDYDTLIRAIKEKLFRLDDEWKVLNGHGNSTTIGKERRSNPFLV